MFHTFRGSPGSSRGTLLRVLLATGSSNSPPTATSSIYQKVSGDSYIYFYFAKATLLSSWQTTTSRSYLSLTLTFFLLFSQLREQKRGGEESTGILTSRSTSTVLTTQPKKVNINNHLLSSSAAQRIGSGSSVSSSGEVHLPALLPVPAANDALQAAAKKLTLFKYIPTFNIHRDLPNFCPPQKVKSSPLNQVATYSKS
jgi:hypothetical protein